MQNYHENNRKSRAPGTDQIFVWTKFEIIIWKPVNNSLRKIEIEKKERKRENEFKSKWKIKWTLQTDSSGLHKFLRHQLETS